MIVRISALREGFRRCGIAHSVQPVDHPVERFSEADLVRLLAEPLLKVQLLNVGEDGQFLAGYCAQLVDEKPLAPLPDDAYPAGASELAVELLAGSEKPAEGAEVVDGVKVADAPAEAASAAKPSAKADAKASAKAGK